MITPKEKAKELVDKFINSNNMIFLIEGAKECALISINEMFEEISKWAGGDFVEWEIERWKYLSEVKQEIELL